MGRLLDAYFAALKHENDAAVARLSERMWLNPPYTSQYEDRLDALDYAMRFTPVKLKYSNYGFASDLFDVKVKMEAKDKSYWIVFNDRYGNVASHKGDTGNRRFDTEYAATARAEECARDNPGNTFTVYKAVSRSVIETPAVTTRLK